MKIERLHEYVLPVVAIVCGLGFALFCGRLSGEGSTGWLFALFASALFFISLLLLRERVWMLIPIFWFLSGKLVSMKWQPGLRDMVVVYVFVSFFALKALKVVRGKPKLTAVDYWAGALLLYLLTVYVRNPVGGEVLGSEKIGGRPYLNVFIATLALWVLARSTLQPKLAAHFITIRRFYLAVVFGMMIPGFLALLFSFSPWAAHAVGHVYGGEPEDDDEDSGPTPFDDEGGSGRVSFLLLLGNPLFKSLCASFRPLSLLNPFSALFKPLTIFRFLGFLFAIALILISGFRSALVNGGAFFLICSYFRRGMSDVIRIVAIGFIGLVLLLSMQGVAFQLPRSIQRSLSFLPGNWDESAKADADNSVEWRVWMWEQMMFTDKYIDNKLLGDGFGLTMQQLAQGATAMKSGSAEEIQEHFMTVGQVHSGPITAIRYVGYVGLFLYLGLLIATAIEAWRTVRAGKETPFFSLALFVCVPLIWEPVNYVVIFGSFDGSFPELLMSIGMLKMVGNSIAAYREENPLAPVPARPRPIAYPRRRPALAGASI